jgi:cell division protein FtsL
VPTPPSIDVQRRPATPDNELVEAYLQRAQGTDTPHLASSADQRDAVYSSRPDTVTGASVAKPRNRTVTRRRVSPFSIVLTLIATAVASVVYISNIITVGQLVVRIGDLESRHQRLLNEQEMLKAQINRMSSLERVRTMAEQDLGLRNSAAVPGWLAVSPDRVTQIEEALEEARRQR